MKRTFTASEILAAMQEVFDDGNEWAVDAAINHDELKGRGGALAGLAAALHIEDEWCNYQPLKKAAESQS